LVGSIYGRASIKIAHFVAIRYQTWLPQAILVSDWSISKKSIPLQPHDQINRHLVGSIKKQGLPVAAMFDNGSQQNEQSL
jgi:hypothetical protein